MVNIPPRPLEEPRPVNFDLPSLTKPSSASPASVPAQEQAAAVDAKVCQRISAVCKLLFDMSSACIVGLAQTFLQISN